MDENGDHLVAAGASQVAETQVNNQNTIESQDDKTIGTGGSPDAKTPVNEKNEQSNN